MDCYWVGLVPNPNPSRILARLRAGLMPASGPPAREGADIETMDGQVVGKAAGWVGCTFALSPKP